MPLKQWQKVLQGLPSVLLHTKSSILAHGEIHWWLSSGFVSVVAFVWGKFASVWLTWLIISLISKCNKTTIKMSFHFNTISNKAAIALKWLNCLNFDNSDDSILTAYSDIFLPTPTQGIEYASSGLGFCLFEWFWPFGTFCEFNPDFAHWWRKESTKWPFVRLRTVSAVRHDRNTI